MNCIELFNEVRSWLEAEKFSFLADDEHTCFQLRMNLDHGLVPVRLLCEELPTMLQVICTLPVKVPKGKISGTGLMLHQLNGRLRMGAFYLAAEDGIVSFRLAQPIHSDSDLQKQFCGALGTTINTMDDNLQPLAFYCCSTPNARAAIAQLSPGKKSSGAKLGAPNARFELN